MSNLKEKAEAWLASEDKEYNDGIAIIRQITNSKTLINNLSKKESLTNRDKINYLISRYLNVKYVPLEGVAKAGPLKVEESHEAKGGQKVPDVNTDAEFNKLPEPVQVLVTKKREAFNRRNEVSQKITDLTDAVGEGEPLPDEVEGLTKEALAIDDEIKAIDSQLGYFFKNGKLPEQGGAAGSFAEGVPSLEELEKKINNKKSQVSKAKKNAGLKPDNQDLKEKLAKLEYELKDLIWQRDSLRQGATIEQQTKG